MQILITRNWSKKDYTVGRILVNGEFVCNSLELPVKTKEGDKGSRIPCGTYTIKKRYSPKFKRQVLWITRNGDTAFNYRFILFHAGNIVNDTQGCVLTGINDRIEQAVRDTRGLVLSYRGELPFAWFHAHSGGMTELPSVPSAAS